MKWLVLPVASLWFWASGGVVALAETGVEPAGYPSSTQTVFNLRLGKTPERTRLVFDLSAAPDFQWQAEDDGRELVLLLSGARWETDVSDELFAKSPVLGVEHTQTVDAGALHVALTLREPRRVEIFPLKPHAGNGHRLVVDLYPAQSGNTAPSEETVQESSRVSTAPEAQESVQESDAGATRESIAASAAAAPTSDPLADGAARGAAPAVPGGLPPGGDSASGWLSGLRTSGYAELTSAYTVSGPSHWSLLRARVEPAVTGNLGSSLRFKLAGRAQGDAAFDLEDDYYPDAVRDDQRSGFSIREAYLDAGAGDWQFRLGRQHVVWGEMVGLFLADVVSARDMREFYLQEFDAMRIPQWGVRAERFAGDSHFEFLWIPYPSYDEIGEPGADFYPFPVPAGVPVRYDRPSRDLDNSHWGLRASHLVAGWDLSAFYYQGQDVAPTLYSTPSGLALRNERLKQAGATFSKDFYTWVLRGEAVHTTGRRFYATAPGSVDSFMPEASESIDYVLGVTIPRGDWRLDLQFYGRHLFQYQQDMVGDANEIGYTALINYGFGQRLEWEVLYLSGLNRNDWSLQPRVVYNVTPRWRLQFGADLFGGDPTGLFGQFDHSDRLYLELRRWF